MAGDWIKVRKNLPTDSRVIRISSALRADRFRTLGGILSVWCLFDEHTESGRLDGYTLDLLDEVIGLKGLAAAMALVGWLEVGEDFLVAPRFEKHNGKTAKRRAQESVRKMSARNADEMRTKCGLEKRREEKRRIEEIPPNPQGGMAAVIADDLWSICPKMGRERSSKAKLLAQLKKLPAATLASGDLMEAMRAWIASESWTRDDGQYVPGIDRWIKDGKWLDRPEPAAGKIYKHAGIKDGIEF